MSLISIKSLCCGFRSGTHLGNVKKLLCKGATIGRWCPLRVKLRHRRMSASRQLYPGGFNRSAQHLKIGEAEQLARFAKEIGVTIGQRPIRIVDGSRLEGPGDRVWRLHLCYDAGHARIVDAAITTTNEGERLDRLSVTPGKIRLGDRGFPQPRWDQEHLG